VSGFIVVMQCEDCTGQDSYGCYDGRPWYAIDPDDPSKDEELRADAYVFATREAAQEACDDLNEPWYGTIEEAQ